MRGAMSAAKFCAFTVPLTRTVACKSPSPTTAVDTEISDPFGSSGVALGFEIICRPGAQNQYGDEDSPHPGPPFGRGYLLRRNRGWSRFRFSLRPAWSGHTTRIRLHVFLPKL